jgi:hypothetical protein
MTEEDMKYKQVLNMLRQSKPVLKDAEAISEKVIKQLTEEKSNISLAEMIIEYFFGWAYIGWVRRSMIVAVLVIVILFGYQQALILRRINDLSGQRIQNSSFVMTNLRDDLVNKMMEYRIEGWDLSNGRTSVSEKEINELINSLNKLQVKYKDLFYLIENDPQLKKYVETRMNDSNKTKH